MGRSGRGVVRAVLCVATVVPSMALAQSYARTETIQYHDNATIWVLGQVAKVTCVASVPASSTCNGGAGSVMSETSYSATHAVPTVSRQFGKIQQTLGYDTTSAVNTGQRGTVRTVADGNNQVTTVTSWKRGVPQSIQFPATPEAPTGATRTASVSDQGWLNWVTDETGSRTCYQYDPMGRITKITYPSETAGVCDSSVWAETHIVFGNNYQAAYGLPAGHWRQRVTTGQGLTETLFDAMWRPLVVQSYDMTNATVTANTISQTIYRYDAQGRAVFQSYPQRTLDPAITNTWGNLAVAPNAKGTYTDYDALDRVTQVRQDWEGSGQLTTATAYLAGFKTRVTDPRQNQTTTEYLTYDQPAHDWPVRISHPAGTVTDISRDAFGKPREIMRSGDAP